MDTSASIPCQFGKASTGTGVEIVRCRRRQEEEEERQNEKHPRLRFKMTLHEMFVQLLDE
jgi:hypothetical protein